MPPDSPDMLLLIPPQVDFKSHFTLPAHIQFPEVSSCGTWTECAVGICIVATCIHFLFVQTFAIMHRLLASNPSKHCNQISCRRVDLTNPPIPIPSRVKLIWQNLRSMLWNTATSDYRVATTTMTRWSGSPVSYEMFRNQRQNGCIRSISKSSFRRRAVPVMQTSYAIFGEKWKWILNEADGFKSEQLI